MKQDFEATMAANWETIAGAAATLHGAPDQTIDPPQDAADTGQRQLIQDLLGPDVAPGPGRIELGATLGSGGMGIVHLGQQKILDRPVAVKTLKAEVRDPRYTRKLLQEAWVSGRLEHPNIVPVHDIAMGDDGAPMIVLKKIEGQQWADLMHDEAALLERFDADDPFEWNVRVLMQVCNAVSFAHERGIVHLDIKPQNVMIGEFGEVYLVDWGLAMSVAGDAGGRLPTIDQHQGIIGTPYYMAPEMTGGADLSTRTDVYLIGANLFELATGRPPHRGETIPEILHAICFGQPEYPDDMPAELRKICARALARDPADRYESVEALRTDLARYLRHRGSLRLVAEAQTQAVELEALLDREDDSDEKHQRIYAVFGAIRFALREALQSWSRNQSARELQQRVTRWMIDYELQNGEPRAAQALATELSSVPAELAARIEQAVSAEAALRDRVERLEQMGRDRDPAVGKRTRIFLMGVMGTLWIGLPLWGEYQARHGFVLTAQTLINSTAAFLVVGAALFVWARESMTKTSINRSFAAIIGGMLLAQLILIYACQHMGLSIEVISSMCVFLWAVTAMTASFTVEIRFAPMIVVFFLAFWASIEWPEHIGWISAGSQVLLVLNAAVLWWPERIRGPLPPRRFEP